MFGLSTPQPPYAWVAELKPENRQKTVRVGAHSTLAKLPRGAVLSWAFDVPDASAVSYLLVYLTDGESQTVFDTPFEIGVLENVRARLGDRNALLIIVKEDAIGTIRPYQVPDSKTTEREFVADLMIAAKTAPEYVKAARQSFEEAHSLRGERVEAAERAGRRAAKLLFA